MRTREEIISRFEELKRCLEEFPEMPHREAMIIIDAMRKCVEEKNALQEAGEWIKA